MRIFLRYICGWAIDLLVAVMTTVVLLVLAVALSDGQPTNLATPDFAEIFRRSKVFEDGITDCPFVYDSQTRKFVCYEGAVLVTSFSAKDFNLTPAGSPALDCSTHPCALTFPDDTDLDATVSFVMPSRTLTPQSVFIAWEPATADVGGVVWGIKACAYEDGETPCTPSTVGAQTSFAAGAGNRSSAEVSFVASWPPGSTVLMAVSRLKDDPVDTMLGDGEVSGVRLEMAR